MRQVTFEDTLTGPGSETGDILFLIAPNYEARSLAWCETLPILYSLIGNERRRLLVGMLTLQAGMHQNVVLERLKWQHTQQAISFLSQRNRHLFPWEKEVLQYPQDFSIGSIEGILKTWTKKLERPLTVYLDLSGLPRKVIVGLAEVLERFARGQQIARLFMMYAWANRYPRAGRPSNVGALKMAEDGMTLNRFLEDVSDVTGVLLAGREGYSGNLFMDSLPPNARVDAYIYMAKDNPLSSLRTVLSNSSLLSQIDVKTNASLHYYLSIPRGHQMLIEHAVRIAREWSKASDQSPTRAYLVAPFGPKPMLFSGYVATQLVRQAGGRSGIVLLSGHHYGDLYSIGHRGLACYEVDLNELVPDREL